MLRKEGKEAVNRNLIQKPEPISKIKSEDIDKKYKYQCSACKYKFSRNNEFRGMCPYCSKLGTVEKIEDLV